LLFFKNFIIIFLPFLPCKTTDKIINSRKKYDESLIKQKKLSALYQTLALFFVFSRIGRSLSLVHPEQIVDDEQERD